MLTERISYGLVGLYLIGICGCSVRSPDSSYGRSAIDEALTASIKDNNAQVAKIRHELWHHNNAMHHQLIPELKLPRLSDKHAIEIESRFNVAVNNLPVQEFFMNLVKGTKYNIILEPGIQGNITLKLQNVTIPQVIEAVHDIYNFEYEVTSYGYKIFKRRLETKVFHLNYIDIVRDGQSHTSVGSGQITNTIQNTLTSSGVSTSNTAGSTPSGVVNTTVNSKFWGLLQENLETLIGREDGRSIVVNARSGVVIVKAFPEEIRTVANYLDQVQEIMNRQVIIEAKVLEVALNAGFQSGINWKALGFTQGYANGVFDEVAAESFKGIANAKITGGNNFSAVISLLNTQGEVNVLSSPRIATINNQKAVIKVGTDRFFVTDVSSNTSSNNSTSNSNSSVTLTPFFSGISLDVTPQIDENNFVTIHIHPIISEVEEDKRQFEVDSKTQSLPLARSTVRESDTIVRARSGQVIVIGGLMETNSTNKNDSTPVADQLPLVRSLFKNSRKNGKKYELVILLKPIIAEGVETWQKELRSIVTRIKKHPDDYAFRMQHDKKAALPLK